MPTSVLTRQRSWVARIAVLALFASLLVMGAVPASAAVNDTSASCPSSIPSAGFTDIATYDATTQAAINCIADYGITKGTSATTYGPAVAVARWQMALFLTRQAAVHGVTLPSGADQGFTDISGLDAATQTAINQLAQLGISKGTSATTFAPMDDVTREQMALFLARLLGAVTTLPASPASAGFTDIAGLSAESQLAINQLAEVGVAAGTSATTYAPAADVLRWQMALFLTRVLAEDGIVPVGAGAFIWKVDTANNAYYWADAANCASVKVTYLSTDAFFINGVSATLSAFEAALDKLDVTGALALTAGNNGKMAPGTNSHTLTTGVKVTSGVAGTVVFGTGEFWFNEPVSGNTLAEYVPNQTYTIFTVDGVTTNLQAFKDDLSVGDSIAVTGGDGTTAAKVRTYALTNGTVSGTVSADVAAAVSQDVTIDTDCEAFTANTGLVAGDSASSFTIDGTAGKTELEFNTAATANDAITYARAGKKVTWTLTNQAQAPYVGRASTITAPNVTIAKSSTSSQVVDWTSVATLRVNGAVASTTDFAAAVSLGDSITYQADNPATTTDESALNLTSGAFSGKPKTFADPAIALTINGQTSETVSINDTAPADLQLATVGTGTVKYSTNGSAAANTTAARDAFIGAVNAIIAGTFSNGTVSVAQVGNDIVWSVSTS